MTSTLRTRGVISVTASRGGVNDVLTGVVTVAVTPNRCLKDLAGESRSERFKLLNAHFSVRGRAHRVQALTYRGHS